MPRELIVFKDGSYIDSNRIAKESILHDYEKLIVPDGIQQHHVSTFVFFSTPHLSCNEHIEQTLVSELSELVQ